MFHNESFNIWSHLCGFIAYILLFFVTIFFIHTHTFFVTDIQTGRINNEFVNYSKPIIDNINSFNNMTNNFQNSFRKTEEYIKNYTYELKNQTLNLWDKFEDNLVNYKHKFTRINE